MLGRYLIIIGLLIAGAGVIILLAPKLPFLGKLPGDIYYKKDSFTFYFPITTSIIVSIILSLIFYFLSRR